MSVAERYIELGLRLGRHIDGLVDAYYGPQELSERVEAEELREPARSQSTRRSARGDRRRRARASRRAGSAASSSGSRPSPAGSPARRFAFADEVERCYGVRPERTSEDRFEAAHRAARRGPAGRRLARRALPGLARGQSGRRPSGWRRCWRRWSSRSPQSHRRALRAAGGRGAELELRHRRAVGGVQLLPRRAAQPDRRQHRRPDGAELRSRADGARDLPGHHTEHAWKEQLLLRETGPGSRRASSMIGTPQSHDLRRDRRARRRDRGSRTRTRSRPSISPGSTIEYDAELSRAVAERPRAAGLGRRERGAAHARGRCLGRRRA